MQSFRFPSVCYHKYLSWVAFVNYFRREIFRSIDNDLKLKYLLPGWLIKQLYASLSDLKLQYCLLLWGTTTRANFKQLLAFQKWRIQLIDHLPWSKLNLLYLIEHSILTFDELFSWKIANSIHSQINTDCVSFYDTHPPKQTYYNLRHQQFLKPKIGA